MKAQIRLILMFLASGLTACDGSHPTAAVIAPTPVPPPGSSVTRVDGSVRDISSRPLAGATVEVLDGPQAAAFALTDGSGAFSFTGVFDDTVRFRAAKAGHAAAIKTSQLPQCANCSRHVDFVLESSGPPIEVAGDYALTFIADPACAGIPEGVRQRTYAATATRDQSGARKMIVQDPSVLHDYAWEGVVVETGGDFLVMGVGNLHGSPGLVERVAPDAYVSFDGWAQRIVGTPEAVGMVGFFEGVIEYCGLPADSPSPVAGGQYSCQIATAVARVKCNSTKHRFILTER